MKSRDLFVWNKSNVLIFVDKVFTALTCYMLNNVHASGQFYLDFIKALKKKWEAVEIRFAQVI